MNHYSASAFFNAMFLTPPYPSSMEMMLFAPLQAQKSNQGCNPFSGDVGASLNYWGSVSQMADAYPNIRLVFEIAFNTTSSTYGLSCFNVMVQNLAQYQSVYGLGVEGEYANPGNGLTNATMRTAFSYVASTGKQFVNYFFKGGIAIPPGGYQIYHTNFPMQGDQVGTLTNSNSRSAQIIGISSGYYDDFLFPSPFTCPIGPNDVANGSLTSEPQGYNRCVVSTELSAALSVPVSARQFLEFAPGFSSNGTFIGVSGLSTNQLWDNSNLRSWIWADPSYQSDFTLSTTMAAASITITTTSIPTAATLITSATFASVTIAMIVARSRALSHNPRHRAAA
jgi:hypothetical protein